MSWPKLLSRTSQIFFIFHAEKMGSKEISPIENQTEIFYWYLATSFVKMGSEVSNPLPLIENTIIKHQMSNFTQCHSVMRSRCDNYIRNERLDAWRMCLEQLPNLNMILRFRRRIFQLIVHQITDHLPTPPIIKTQFKIIV